MKSGGFSLAQEWWLFVFDFLLNNESQSHAGRGKTLKMNTALDSIGVVPACLIALGGFFDETRKNKSKFYEHCTTRGRVFTHGLSGGGLAPPASPRRRCSFVGSNLTHPQQQRSLVEDCRRALRAVKPGLVWAYESGQHRDI
ncbi:hypothetical protein Dimus_035172 [Dionaea muscipula]